MHLNHHNRTSICKVGGSSKLHTGKSFSFLVSREYICMLIPSEAVHMIECWYGVPCSRRTNIWVCRHGSSSYLISVIIVHMAGVGNTKSCSYPATYRKPSTALTSPSAFRSVFISVYIDITVRSIDGCPLIVETRFLVCKPSFFWASYVISFGPSWYHVIYIFPFYRQHRHELHKGQHSSSCLLIPMVSLLYPSVPQDCTCVLLNMNATLGSKQTAIHVGPRCESTLQDTYFSRFHLRILFDLRYWQIIFYCLRLEECLSTFAGKSISQCLILEKLKTPFFMPLGTVMSYPGGMQKMPWTVRSSSLSRQLSLNPCSVSVVFGASCWPPLWFLGVSANLLQSCISR